jgi:amino acid transporter
MNRPTLARRTLGAGKLWIFAVGASSPLTVLAGGIVQTYATTGVVGVPLSFMVIGVVVALLAVGYVAMSRYVVHPAPFYALLARGLSRSAGVGGGFAALLGYNAIQISLFPLVGVTFADLAGGSWQMWAWIGWLIVAGLGWLGGTANANVLGTMLAVELAVIGLFVVAAFAHPAAGHIDLSGLAPGNLVVTGVSGVLALGMAAFVGVEIPPTFGEEARPSAVRRAMLAAVVFLAGFYTLAALAYSVTVGPNGAGDAARSPGRDPLSILGGIYNSGVTTLAKALLVTSIIAAMTAFHGAIARYLFAMAREHVLPSRLAMVSHGTHGGTPRAGSVVQSVFSAAMLTVFMAAGADPMAVMFTWLSAIGAVCVLSLLIASSLAARLWFAAGGGSQDGAFARLVAPVAGAVLGVLILAMTLANLTALLGTPPGSRWPWLVPVLIAAAVLAGLSWGGLLKVTRPAVWQQIGKGTPDPITVADHRLADVEV